MLGPPQFTEKKKNCIMKITVLKRPLAGHLKTENSPVGQRYFTV